MWCTKYMQKPYNTNLLILMEIIHPNQIAILFFLLCFGKCYPYTLGMKWHVMLLKLDFARAYDKVSWDFLFGVMKAFGMAKEFVHIVHIFLLEVEVIVNFNGTPLFWLGWHIVPYLFILVGKALNVYLFKKLWIIKKIEGSYTLFD